MDPKSLVLSSAGTIAASVGGWQSYEGSNPSNHGQLFWKGYRWSPPSSKYDHPITLPEGENPWGFRLNGCFQNFFNNEVKFDYQDDQVTSASDDFKGAAEGKVEACFIGDLRYRKKSKQNAISLKTELALIKGNHGLAVWTVLSNLRKTGSGPEEQIRLVRLSKSGSQWKIEKGYAFAAATRNTGEFSKLKVKFKNSDVFSWGGATNELCKSTKNNGGNAVCEDWNSKDESSLKWFEIFEGSTTGTEDLFGRLVVEDPGVSEAYKYSFWKPNDKNWNNAMGWNTVKAVYDGTKGLWKKTKTNTLVEAANEATKWLEPFKSVKGTWYDGNRWCNDQAKIKGGTPSDLFKEACYRG